MSIHLTFDQIRYSIGDKEILKAVSGQVGPGEMLVILGPSGCGKTTLLNILSAEVKVDSYSGVVRMNGKIVSRAIDREMAYVKQAEVINPLLTIKENLEYTAKFRLTKTDRQAQVERIINEFGLDQCQNTLTGSNVQSIFGKNVAGVSGGQRRRAYIAQEILTNPALIFFDEPTSGLDSFSALSVLTVIKALATQRRCTVIVTLHQPSSEMFAMFDKLMLMVCGKVAYFGKASEAVNFFADANMPCQQYHNPADHFLTKLSDKDCSITLVNQYAQRVGKEVENKSDIEEGNGLILEPVVYDSPPRQPSKAKMTVMVDHPNLQVDSKRYSLPYNQQFTTLLKRSLVFSWRSFSPLSISFTLIIAIFIGLCAIRGKSLEIIDSRVPILNTVLFLGFIYAVGFMPTINAISLFLFELPVVDKETKNGSYNPLIYFIAKRIGETPVDLIQAMIHVIIVYFMVGLRIDQYILAHTGVMIICGSIASVLGVFYVVLTRENQGAVGLQGLYAIICLLTMGYYIPIHQLPVWMRWFQWIQFYRYGYESLLRIQYTGQTIKHIANSGFLSQENLQILGNNTYYGDSLLYKQLGIELSTSQDIGALAGFWALAHVLIFVAFYFMIVRKSK